MDPAFGRHLSSEFIPLVDDKNAGLVLVGNIVSELLVDFAESFGTVKEEKGHVGAANAALCSMKSIPIDVGANRFVTTKARRVDGNEALPVQFEMDVDAVARCSRNFADDHSLGFGKRVDERTLAVLRRPTIATFIAGGATSSAGGFHIRKSLID